ncbi:hypothetical protein Esi_0000_0608 [Ectocarpus siliculosus]|uniref:Uncharacterized protein n=1 Tax=Ectocarpus siliculosus TaxID=2880 RepID=D8LBR7_ECTSI|nr:hypothetical protein Esi_0000_0608 [Ectocarpus siliculosus]|eukprot:CBN76776.1 hypothetical protein Esi_0000_0608 [Ectocarpus siliculosus]
MCSTKHYQAPRSRSPLAAVEVAQGAGNGVGGAHDPAIRADTQRRRQSGGGTQERRSPRSSRQDTEAANVSSSEGRRKEQRSGGILAGGKEASSGDGAGGGVAPRKRRRSKTPARATTARGAEPGGLVASLSADAPAPTAKSTPSRKKGGDGLEAAAAAETAVATPTVHDGKKTAGGDGERGAKRTAGASRGGALSSPYPSSRKGGKKRARTPTPPTPAPAVEEVEASPSPVTVTHPTESPPPPPPAGALPRERQAKVGPCIVPPLTADSDERDGDSGSRTRRRRRRGESGVSDASEDVAATRGPTVPPSSENAPPSSCADGRHSWPTAIARVATLDFSGKPSLVVSSVVVTSAGSRGRGSGSGSRSGSRSRTGSVTTAATASIVVCHSGGVSVWDLTDSEAICTHLSPELASAAKELVPWRFMAAAVVGGDLAGSTPSATRAPGGGKDACIMAVGRQGTDPGSPIFRVWQQGSPSPVPPLTPQGAGRADRRRSSGGTVGGSAGRAKEAPALQPAVLTTTVKKKFSKFFPPAVPSHVTPCLCVCGYSGANGERGDGAGGAAVGDEGGPGAETSEFAREITAVMALGGKALRLVFGAGRSGSETFVAKQLPARLADDAVYTSLAPVPSNPYLVCASAPLVNSVLVWNVLDLRPLFTLPITTVSVCVPLAAAAAGNAAVARGVPRVAEAAAAEAAAEAAAAKPAPRMLCLLATGSRHAGGSSEGGVSSTRETSKVGCGLFGVYCGGGDGGAGKHSCGRVSAIRLEADAEAGAGERPVAGEGENGRSRGGGEHDHPENDAGSGLRCLRDGGYGFVVGVDGRGKVVARSVLTGESRVLLAPDTAAAAANAGGGATFATLGCDGDSSILALATARGPGGVAAATCVDLYEFCG